MSTIKISSPTLEIHVDADDPLYVERIVRRSTGQIVSEGSRQRFLVRFPRELSDPVFPTEVVSVDATKDRIEFRLRNDSRGVRLLCEIESVAEGICWRMKAEASEPMWMVEWRIGGLDLSRVIVPALGGQYLGDDMPADTQVTYKYPFWWNAQFGVGELSGGGGVWLRTLDTEPVLKLLRVNKAHEHGHFGLGLGFEADASLDSTAISAAWYFDGYQGDWKEPADTHRRWLEAEFGLIPFAEHPHYPKWADDVDFILEIWGASKERPEPLHTFAEMQQRIREFAGHHPPSSTLLYLPGFANGGIDSDAPDYTPSAMLGGEAGFRELIDEAHELGYRVMVHTNVLALSYTHPLFPRFESMQVIDAFGRRQGWGNDIDGDWLAEPFFAYVNPGYTEWGDHMEEVIGHLVEHYGVDGVFLDQTLLAFNVSEGPNFVKGMRSHVERLQRSFPDVLFAGEGLHEQILPALPMAQIHGIDSIAGIHGLEGAREWRHVHPVSAYLFRKFTRLTAHLLTKHPSSSVFERQESAYRELGVVPALVLYRTTHEIDTPVLEGMIQRAESLAAAPPGRDIRLVPVGERGSTQPRADDSLDRTRDKADAEVTANEETRDP